MGKFLFCFALFFFSGALAQQKKIIPLVKGPQIKFDTPEIIDTITISDLDTNCMCVAGDNKYIFQFTNIGNEPLIVQESNGSDPDFNCAWTNEPVKPGGRGSITICAWHGKYYMDKTYHINDNSATKETIHIKRVKQIPDSVYQKYQKRYDERWEKEHAAEIEKKRIADSKIVTLIIDSLPEPLHTQLRMYSSKTITIDTSYEFFGIDSTDGNGKYKMYYSRKNILPDAIFYYQTPTQLWLYDIHGLPVYSEILLQKKKGKKHLYGPDVPPEYKIIVTTYTIGIKTSSRIEHRKSYAFTRFFWI